MLRTLRPGPCCSRRRLPLLLLVGGTLLGAPGCRAEGVAEVLHWPTTAPPAVQGDAPVVRVALASRLGPAPGTPVQKAPVLLLEGAGGGLELIDASGRRLSGPRLQLVWQRVALPQPLHIARSVLGPFPSFESAEQAAEAWRQQGVTPAIAHPGEWEVWGPAAAEPPPSFQSRVVRRVETTRLELQAVQASGSPPQPLTAPLRLRASAGLRWKGGVFDGPFRLQPNAYGGWSLIEEAPLERYLLGVVPHEIGAGAPAAALAAQSVLARTWALRNSHRYVVDGYHLCADTQCQVYADPRQAGGAVRRALQATQGQVLAWQGRPIHAVYHASNGGVSAGFEEVWSGSPLPYLQARPDGPAAFAGRTAVPLTPSTLTALLRGGGDAYGADHPLFRWTRTLTAGEIRQALEKAAAGVGVARTVTVVRRGPSGRVLELAVEGSGGRRVLRLDAIRRTLRRLPSTLFEVAPAGPAVWRFSGGGFGHGAGLSQAGAIDLARRGWSLSRILSHYYPGTQLMPLKSLGQGQ